MHGKKSQEAPRRRQGQGATWWWNDSTPDFFARRPRSNPLLDPSRVLPHVHTPPQAQPVTRTHGSEYVSPCLDDWGRLGLGLAKPRFPREDKAAPTPPHPQEQSILNGEVSPVTLWIRVALTARPPYAATRGRGV